MEVVLKLVIMREPMLYRSVVVGLLARDCKEAILRNKPRIEKLCSFFDEYHIVVVENDSVDGTKELLHDWAQENGRVVVDSFTDESKRLADCSVERISHMADLRNRLLGDIRRLPVHDIVIMMDVDIFDFDVEGVIDGISQAPDDWGAIMANGRLTLPNHKLYKYQYDQYAFLAYDEDWHDAMYFQQKRGRLLDKRIRKNAYYPVQSAFGGIGVYRYDAIKDLHYQAVRLKEHPQDAFCEHIPFHLEIIRQGYQNYVCRRMTVNSGLLEVKPWVAFLMCYLPQVYEMLCKVSAFMYKMNWR